MIINKRLTTLLLSGILACTIGTLYCAATASGAAAQALSTTRDQPPADKGISPEFYAKTHQMSAHVFSSLKDSLKQPAVVEAMGTIKAELDKLPALEKAYIDAKNAGDESTAKAAADDYEQSVKKIVALAVPLDREILPTLNGYTEKLASLGTVGEKLKAEPDVAALLADIDLLLKPLNDANEQVGPIEARAADNARKRFAVLRAKMVDEEMAKAALKDLLARTAADTSTPK